QSDEQKNANRRLQSRYPVEGYPTIVIADETGRPLGITGYIAGGPKPFIANLKQIPNAKWKQPEVALPAPAPAASVAAPTTASVPEDPWAGIKKTPPKRYDDLKLTG